MKEEFQVDDLTVRIIHDSDYESPREWDNIGTMVCWHSKYNLGDKHEYKSPQEFLIDLFDECDPDNKEIRSLIAELIKDEGWQEDYRRYFVNNMHYAKRESIRHDYLLEVMEGDGLPGWLQGKIQDLVREHYVILPLYLYDHSGITMNTTGFDCLWDSGQVGYIYASKAKAEAEGLGVSLEEFLKSEVETYDQYLTGDVWGYSIEDEHGNHIDSCWGFYGQKYCIEEAKEKAEHFASPSVRQTYVI